MITVNTRIMSEIMSMSTYINDLLFYALATEEHK